MLARHADPIVAIATASGRGAVGIVRVSGRDLRGLVEALFGRSLEARHATLLPLREADGTLIDQGLALYFPAPHSYTGEDVLELQVHGGAVLLQMLLARCLQAGAGIGLRLAEPGEFTQRAFLNNKLDLAQAEAVADLIDASTSSAVRSASRSLQGEFSRRLGMLAQGLLKLRMLVEATLDFPEEDIDFLNAADARGQLHALQGGVAQVLAQARQGALLRDGLRVVLAGQPNVGKSSLLNALAGAELAIVTPIAGTTRDRIAQSVQIDGVPLHLTDTAGLRWQEGAADEIERIGIERSWQAIAQADVVIFLHDLARLDDADYRAAEDVIAQRLRAHLAPGSEALDVYNKADLGASAPPGGLAISARHGAGLPELRQALLARCGWQGVGEGSFIARARHVQALLASSAHLDQAAGHLDTAALDLLAEELRLAHAALGRITGAVSADELLGEIFSRFCIGK